MEIDPKPRIPIIGSKAYYLHKMKEICNVPHFFVISFDKPEELKEDKNQKKIIERFDKDGLKLVSVRSSANLEDSKRISFAGMFKTILGVKRKELIESISSVLGSLDEKRVISYCKVHYIDHSKLKMSVIVQRMIASRVSGVCFTRSEAINNTLILEACYGLGEALVSGKITPDTYIISRETLNILEKNIGYQKSMSIIDPKDGQTISSSEIPFYKRNARKLSLAEIKEVARTCLKIEKSLKFLSADVEWAFEEDKAYYLQARPFTGYQKNTINIKLTQ